MTYGKNKFSKILKVTSLMCFFSCMGITNVDALKVKEITKLPGVEVGYEDKDVPVALEVIEGGDGIKTGAYLYRHTHQGVDFYAPWTPDVLKETEADKNKSAYDNWGFWNMAANQQKYGITSPTYYTKGKITTKYSSVSVYNSLAAKVGTMAGGATIKIYGVTTDRVFINSEDYSGITQGASESELVWINKDYVVLNDADKIDIVYSGYSSDVYLMNFKRSAKYKYNARPIHYGVETGRWINPSTSNVPSSVRGKSGEWRFIGYNRYGDPLDNPYFPADTQSVTHTYIYGSAKRHTPWNPNDKQSGESDPYTAYEVFTRGLNGDSLNFTYDTDSRYSEMKDYVVNKLFAQKIIKTTNNVKNEISLKTNAYKQGIILKNQRKTVANYSVPFIEGTLRDLYAYSMEIWEIETNTKIASLNGSTTSSKVAQTGTYKPGRSYEVRIRLGNGADATLIKKSLEAQFGLVYNAGSISNNMAFKKTKNQETQTQGNYGGLGSTKGSKSNEFIFKFSTSSNQTGPIDVYGFVGFSHTGVDNLNYKNDLIGIRLSQGTPPSTDNCVITNNGKTKTCGSADIKPVSIQLIDENGAVKYEYSATNGVTIRNAIIPGKKYKIRYNAQVAGGSITVSNWVDAVNDNPNTAANEFKPGYWGAEKTASYTIPLTYSINRPVKNPSTAETYNSGTVYFVGSNGSTNIPIAVNTNMSYTTGYIVMQYPKLTTGFKITSTNAKVNNNTSNDSLSTTVTDTFDIGVSNLVVTPLITYTDGQAKSVSYNVAYNAILTTPSYVSINDYQAYVNTSISINGQTYNVKDQLIKGTNNKLTHIIDNVTVPGTGNVTVSINVNSDKLSYESGNYDNNKASTMVKTEKVKNPGLGSVNDTVKAPVQNDNNPNAGGNANNNCLIPRTKNTWTSIHRKLSWTSNSITYNTLVSGESVTFNKYNLNYNNSNEATETYQESFGIKQILFKSKETTDNGYGNNGWVDLLIAGQAKYAEIKAGYGFELKIVTNYSTDALTKRTWTISNNGSSGTDVSAINGGINYGMEEVFLELPGTKDTRKILSTTGYEDSIKGLQVTKSGSGSNVTWTYTIKPSNTVGSNTSPKIYIPTEMKDGDYKLKIYTTPVQGVGSVNKKQYSALCDRKEVAIKVKGTASDDLNSNIIQ